jgi:hypothetical protein
MEVSQEIIDRCRRNNLFLSRVDWNWGEPILTI